MDHKWSYGKLLGSNSSQTRFKKDRTQPGKEVKKKKSKLGPDNSMIERRMKSLGVSGKPPDLE